MGLTVALSNALSGMNVGQRALDVLSRNVANAGTPGYHRQSMSVIDKLGSSPYAQAGTLTRAFSSSLQAHYTREVSDSSYADAIASMLDRLQTAFGKPGDAGSLDTAFADFQSALSELATSPDNFATRAQVIAGAQNIAGTLNRLSQDIQELRSDADIEIGNGVANLNRALAALETLNTRLSDESADPASRAALMDQRDRLIADVAGEIDINVDYHANGTVGIMTRAGVGILDSRAGVFSYDGGGHLSSNSLFSADPGENGVGSLTLTSTSGLKVDLVAENILQSGRLSALVKLRDDTLVRAQGQLDDIAAALAQSLSTVETAGTAVTSGAATGFEVDIAGIRPGNDIVIDYRQGSQTRQIRVVRVEDPTQLPMDRIDANGTRVIGLSFAGGAATVASALNGILGPGLAVSNPSGAVLRVLDDGAAGNTDVSAVTARSTVAGTQNSGLALSLFVDAGNADFTDAITTADPQRRGFASRITVNSAVRVDNTLLVRYASGGTLGDASRAEYLSDRLDTARFVSQSSTDAVDGNFRLSGTASDMIAQTLNYQGNAASSAQSLKENRDLTMEALTSRLQQEYGVDVDDEMARLMELQNAFAANARIVSAVQDLINALLDI